MTEKTERDRALWAADQYAKAGRNSFTRWVCNHLLAELYAAHVEIEHLENTIEAMRDGQCGCLGSLGADMIQRPPPSPRP